jgi:hypothetical protein
MLSHIQRAIKDGLMRRRRNSPTIDLVNPLGSSKNQGYNIVAEGKRVALRLDDTGQF